MKADIHPEYRAVVFQDTSSGESWITRSTIETDETIRWEDEGSILLRRCLSPPQATHSLQEQ